MKPPLTDVAKRFLGVLLRSIAPPYPPLRSRVLGAPPCVLDADPLASWKVNVDLSVIATSGSVLRERVLTLY